MNVRWSVVSAGRWWRSGGIWGGGSQADGHGISNNLHCI